MTVLGLLGWSQEPFGGHRLGEGLGASKVQGQGLPGDPYVARFGLELDSA